MSGEVTVGILDSGVSGALAPRLARYRRFHPLDNGRIAAGPPVADETGHGSAVTQTVRVLAPTARLAHAQVFSGAHLAAPATIAAGLDWLAGDGADLVVMCFGLAADRAVLRTACARAVERGAILVAASPARGPQPFPAAYPHVIAVTGDARCAAGEVSHLDTAQALFGTHCPPPDSTRAPRFAGASAAAAHFAGLAAAWLCTAPGGGREALLAHFKAAARYRGAERRGAVAE
ncbi:peptidase S8 and S53 subtilisin kexin sedolisin [Kaustia mangrovi]|uniref:Peptidase S8 and S53 subtilisin kexin sedolisin n=1 Tax=Kaustia mangrovi TaxID=2593653 RepID=A0A7S8C3T3_9HYPH|nr:S8 family serine peptidase [Kaustia mangrovi]QPC42874.1 peptidase S8 and S53 subtilisin kexin sedolisin [Kaustia mangrovi]